MRLGPWEITEPVPELSDTIIIAMLMPWVNVGAVVTLTLKLLEREFKAKELAKLSEPGKFLDFTRDRPEMTSKDGSRTLSIPNCDATYAHAPSSGRDFVFLHIREPHMYGDEYCSAIVELAKQFNAVEYCRIGGMYDEVPHTRPLKITGSVGDEYLDKLTGIISPRSNTYQGPTSILQLVGDNLSDAGIENSSIMVHVPHYVQLEEDYLAVARIMTALCAIYEFPQHLSDTTRGRGQYEQIAQAVQENPQIRARVAQMEQSYDSVEMPADLSNGVSLPEGMETFLREAGKKLDED